VSIFILSVFWSLPTGKTVPQYSSVPVPKHEDADVESWCPLPEIPRNRKDGLKPSFLFIDQKSVDLQVKRLSAAVNVPTVSVVGGGDVLTDPKYEAFHKFHGVLDELFPLV
jgi:Gly-Xaa carboxypeptidase